MSDIIYVVTAAYSDGSGSKVLGVFDDENIAEAVREGCAAAGSVMYVAKLALKRNFLNATDIPRFPPPDEENERHG